MASNVPNVPSVQLIYDDAQRAIVKVTGYYTAATATNTAIVVANTLFGANSTSANKPVLSVARVLYAAAFANGYCRLEWSAQAIGNNEVIYCLGGDTQGDLAQYINDPLDAANTPGGSDVNLVVAFAEPNDSFSMVITLNKDNGNGGWANAYSAYNDNTYPH
jgi:hypothetical protein